MARNDTRDDRDEDTRPPFWSESIRLEGNLTRDPKDISRDSDASTVIVSVACNYRDWRGNEDVHYRELRFSGQFAANAYNYLARGDRIVAEGDVEGNRWTPRDSDDERHDMVIRGRWWGLAARFGFGEELSGAMMSRPWSDDSSGGKTQSGRSDRRRSDDGDDDEEPPSRRSSRRGGDDEEERPRRRSRDGGGGGGGGGSRGSEDEERPRRRRRSPVENRGDLDGGSDEF